MISKPGVILYAVVVGGCAPSNTVHGKVVQLTEVTDQMHSGGRRQWSDADVSALARDERALAILAYQKRFFPRNIDTMTEIFELWLRRPETPADFDGAIYLPSRTDLTRLAFTSVWRELSRRMERGEIAIDGDLLERHPDIRDYIPKEYRRDGR